MIKAWRVLLFDDYKIVKDEYDAVGSDCGICIKSLSRFCSTECATDITCAPVEYVWLFLLMLKNRYPHVLNTNVVSLIFEYYLTGFEKITTCSVIRSECGCLFHRHCAEKEHMSTNLLCPNLLCPNYKHSSYFPTGVFWKKKITRSGKLLSAKLARQNEYLHNCIKDECFLWIEGVGRCTKDELVEHLLKVFLKQKVGAKVIENILLDLQQEKRLLLFQNFYFLIKQ